MAFVQRLIEVEVSLASGSFETTGGSTKRLAGLRMQCRIAKAGGLSDSTATVKIYGMTASDMNQLSTLGMQINLVPKNGIVVTAGDAGSPLATVFTGYIVSAYADFANAPDVVFNINAHTGFADAVLLAKATSFQGSADVATIMSGFATQMGKSFENNGVSVQLSNPYFAGSVLDQAKACVRAAGIAWNGGDNGVVAIWPKNGSRGGLVPVVSPETGMIGYPTYSAYGLILKTVFNRAIGLGAKVEVRSSLKAASGVYAVYSLDHDLDTRTPDGQWFSTIGAYNPSLPTPVPNPRPS